MERRLTVIPERRITIPPRARQVVPVVGAALALTWGIGKVLTVMRRRRQQRISRVFIYRRISIRLERPLRFE
jgi:hypothetical protein